MSKIQPVGIAGIAIALFGVVIAFGFQKKSPDDFSHVVKLDRTLNSNGDRITITEVRGPSPRWITGSTYEVVGTCKLASRDKASLGAFVTTSSGEKEPRVSPSQVTRISKGEGAFRLRFPLWREFGDCHIGAICGPHVSMYPAPYGSSFLDVYIQR